MTKLPRVLRNTGTAVLLVVTLGLLAASSLVGTAAAAATEAPATAVPAAAGPETTFERMKRTGVVRSGFTNEPPYSIATADTLTGIDPDIMRAFLDSQGITEQDGVLMEFGSLIPALQADRIDVITAGLWMNPDRCKVVAFSNPTTQIGQAFAVRKGNPLNLHSYKDVATAGARLGANTGGLEWEWADIAGIPKDRQVQFPDLQTSLAALQADRVDAISNNVPAIADALSKLNDPNLEMVALSEQPADKTGQASLAFSSFGFRTEDQDLVDAFDAFVKEIKANGRLLEILEPYGMGPESIPPDDMTREKICGG
jgi:polar amino acid transport system substrate-binding protein